MKNIVEKFEVPSGDAILEVTDRGGPAVEVSIARGDQTLAVMIKRMALRDLLNACWSMAHTEGGRHHE